MDHLSLRHLLALAILAVGLLIAPARDVLWSTALDLAPTVRLAALRLIDMAAPLTAFSVGWLVGRMIGGARP